MGRANWVEISALAALIFALIYFGIELGKVAGSNSSATTEQHETRADIRELQNRLMDCRRQHE